MSAQNPPKRPRISGISEARIRVSDFCKAQDFYFRVLGQRPYCPVGKHFEGGSVALYSSQDITLNVNSLLGHSPANPPSLLEEIGFFTDNAADLEEYLKSRKIRIEEDELNSLTPTLLVRDPEGHRVLFIQSIPPRPPDIPASPLKSRIIHAGFAVRDQAAMAHFYKEILGFHVYWQGGMKDGETDWVDLQVPDGADWIEFMLNVPENPDKQTLGIMNHIALGVPDVRAAAKELESKGMKLPEPPGIGRDGKWQLNLYDPDGTRIELMEFTPVQPPCCSPYTGPHPQP